MGEWPGQTPSLWTVLPNKALSRASARSLSLVRLPVIACRQHRPRSVCCRCARETVGRPRAALGCPLRAATRHLPTGKEDNIKAAYCQGGKGAKWAVHVTVQQLIAKWAVWA
jgi:hypothetical protein